MAVSIPIEEQEISIQASRDLKFATAYVTDRTYMTRLDKLVLRDPEHYKVIQEHKINGDIIGKTYEFPKRLLSFRSGMLSRKELTDEDRQRRSEGLRKWRESQKKL